MPKTTTDPTEEFLERVAELRVGTAGRDKRLLKLGAAMMPVGLAIAVIAWFLSYNTADPLEQRDAVILALIGVTVSIIGVGIFLRYSIGEFLRFWMARLIAQQQTTPPAAADTETPN
jgi:uncharacterized membrane protein YcjF (UPF0283 family)